MLTGAAAKTHRPMRAGTATPPPLPGNALEPPAAEEAEKQQDEHDHKNDPHNAADKNGHSILLSIDPAGTPPASPD